MTTTHTFFLTSAVGLFFCNAWVFFMVGHVPTMMTNKIIQQQQPQQQHNISVAAIESLEIPSKRNFSTLANTTSFLGIVLSFVQLVVYAIYRVWRVIRLQHDEQVRRRTTGGRDGALFKIDNLLEESGQQKHVRYVQDIWVVMLMSLVYIITLLLTLIALITWHAKHNNLTPLSPALGSASVYTFVVAQFKATNTLMWLCFIKVGIVIVYVVASRTYTHIRHHLNKSSSDNVGVENDYQHEEDVYHIFD